jgi:hypothetical protein
MGLTDPIDRLRKLYEGLHPAERDALSDAAGINPLRAIMLYETQQEATRWGQELARTFIAGLPKDAAKARYKASVHNGPADAARHCYWSALLASKLSHNEAMRIVFSHEFGAIERNDANERLEVQMDLHNNRVGLAIGGRAKGAANHELQDAVMKALISGRLRHIDVKARVLAPTKSLMPST